MNRNIEMFDKSWERYTDTIKAKLSQKLNAGQLNISMANILLRESTDKWLTKYDTIGKWFTEYTIENPERAAIIKEILERDIIFTEEVKVKTLPTYLKIGIPVVGGLIFGGVSTIFTESLAIRVVSTIVPTVALYPTVGTIDKQKKSDGNKKLLDDYVLQLEKYRLAIRDIIGE